MPSQKSTRRIYVVDDEHVIASSLGTILRNEGFDTAVFTDPLEAQQAAGTHAPDLLISEVIMLPFSGIELAAKVRQISPDCKVLLFSAQPDAAPLLDAARAEGHDFAILPKPIHPSELISKIRWELELNVA